MPTRRRDRPNEGQRVRLRLPGFGRVGPWQTGLRNRRDAERVEAWLREQALLRPEVVQGIIDGHFTLRDAWSARLRGRLEELLAGVADPKLSVAVARYKRVCRDERAKQGLDQILHYAPRSARLSWLNAKNIHQLYQHAQADGRHAASVYRSLHRAVRELLQHELGERAADVLRGVKAPRQQTRRRVQVTPQQLQRLIAAIDEERFRWMVQTAVLLAIDQGPLRRLTVDSLQDLPTPAVWVDDSKTDERTGLLPLGPTAAAVLRRAAAGLELTDRLFPYTKDQVSHRWDKARRRAQLPHLRFKDLRHLLPSYLDSVGMPIEDIQRVMRHADSATTLIYIQSPQARIDTEMLERAAEAMGLTNRTEEGDDAQVHAG